MTTLDDTTNLSDLLDAIDRTIKKAFGSFDGAETFADEIAVLQRNPGSLNPQLLMTKLAETKRAMESNRKRAAAEAEKLEGLIGEATALANTLLNGQTEGH